MKNFEIKSVDGAVLYIGGGETLRDVVVAAVKRGADLRGANLGGANLSGAALRCAYLSGANLRCAYLSGANLYDANLRGANLYDANLRGANLIGANLSGAYLSGANLSGAALRCAYLSGAYLSGADLRGADLYGAYLGGKKLVGDRPVIQIGPLGSRSDILTGWLTDAGVYVTAGCFHGTLDEFRAAVAKTHGDDSAHANEYGIAALMIEAHAVAWMPADGSAA